MKHEQMESLCRVFNFRYPDWTAEYDEDNSTDTDYIVYIEKTGMHAGSTYHFNTPEDFDAWIYSTGSLANSKGFVEDMWHDASLSDRPRPMTFGEAVTTWQDWMIDGVEVPVDLRPLQLAAWWNELCAENGDELPYDCPTSGWFPAIDDIERGLWSER